MVKKKLGIIIEVRTGSKRLPSKCLKKINNKNIIEILLHSLTEIKNIKKIIATTKLKQDDIIEKIALKNNINIFRGPSQDLVSRVISAAKFNRVDHIIQLTADNPLIDVNILKRMIKIYNENNYEFISNSLVRSFPIGSDIRIFSLKSLIKISKIQKKNREHTCYYFLKNPKKFKTYNYLASKMLNRTDIRLTIDYKEDFELVKKVLIKNKNKKIRLRNIINIIDNNPELKKINFKHPRTTVIN